MTPSAFIYILYHGSHYDMKLQENTTVIIVRLLFQGRILVLQTICCGNLINNQILLLSKYTKIS